MRRPISARSPRSIARSTPSTWRRCSSPCAGSGPRTRRASTTCRSHPDISRARPPRRDRPARRSDRDHGGEHPARAGLCRRPAARPQERRADGRRRDDHRSRHDLDRPGRRRRRRHGAAPGRVPAGTYHDRRALRAPLQRPRDRLDDCGRRVREQLLRDCGIAGAGWRAARAVRAPAAAVRRRRTGARRQLRRDEEDRARRAARRRTTWPISATRSSARR